MSISASGSTSSKSCTSRCVVRAVDASKGWRNGEGFGSWMQDDEEEEQQQRRACDEESADTYTGARPHYYCAPPLHACHYIML